MTNSGSRRSLPSEGSLPPSHGGMLRDPVVRRMAYAAMGIVILFLAMVVGALATGVVKPTAPRTIDERELIVAAAMTRIGGTSGSEWGPYVSALVAAGDYTGARVALDAARASAETTKTAPELELAEARLEFAQERYAQAAKAAQRAMLGFEERQAARLAAGGDTATRAAEIGLEADYYAATLVRAYSFVELAQFEDAVDMFDVYIDRFPTAADILVDRGNAKAEMQDNVGAERDFREALRFVPGDETAIAGLERIGAAQ